MIEGSNILCGTTKKIDQKLSIHGISFTEYRVMDRLYQAADEAMRRIDLAESVGLSASGVTRLLLPMQKIGLVQKEQNPRDARVSLVKLTETGKQIFLTARDIEQIIGTIGDIRLWQG